MFVHPFYLIAFVLNQEMYPSRKKTQIDATDTAAADIKGIEKGDIESVTNIPGSMFHQNADKFNIQTKDHQEGTQIKTHTYTLASVNPMILSESQDM